MLYHFAHRLLKDLFVHKKTIKSKWGPDWLVRKLSKAFRQKWGNVVGDTPLICLQTRVAFNPFAQIPPNQFLRSQFHLVFCVCGRSQCAHTTWHEWGWLLKHPIASLPLSSDVASYLPGHLTLKCCYLWCGDLFVSCTVAAPRRQTFRWGEAESLGVVWE